MNNQLKILEFLNMAGIDVVFLAILMLVMLPIGIWRQAAFAVMKRNFVGYFSNPTGYVFLCLFVLLTSFAAFWPHEFFATNLANFDQLNRFLPYIMLVFIPAITMSTWSEERRQGTDELLLTLPAQDFDIVIGKYFAAVLVFTVSLIFSQLSNYAVLIMMTGGNLDSGLLFSTYLGYWFVGIAMIAIGMVASFLTNNLTVGFIFGVVFNAPLAFFSNADVIVSSSQWVSRMFEWSILQRFDPFGRGLISPSSVVYFLGIVVIGIYLCLVLIGRRHWQGGKHGTSLFGHFVFRTVFLAITAVAMVLLAQYSPLNRLRIDVSAGKVSTLADSTREVLEKLASEQAEDDSLPPVTIDAYVGAETPAEFVQTRYDLLNLLREVDVIGGNRVRVNLHKNVEPFSEDAILAEKRFGIRPVPWQSVSRGAIRQQEIILGAAITSGLNREVIPIFPYGSPIEYELIRSIATVASAEKPRIGIARTDVYATGGVVATSEQTYNIPPLGIVSELEKQYRVDDVDLGQPMSVWMEGSGGARSLEYAVLIVIQPSKMTPAEMANLIAAIEAGQPTLIFEDPFPVTNSMNTRVMPTAAPRNLPVARGGTLENADILQLWDKLGIVVSGRKDPQGQLFIPDLAWKKYNPYKRDPSLDQPERLVINNDVDQAMDTDPQIDTGNPATAPIRELIFEFASPFSRRPDSPYEFERLVVVRNAGRIPFDIFVRATQAGGERYLDIERGSPVTNVTMMLAARISSKADAADLQPGDVNCIFVSDADLLSDEAILLRNSPIQNGIEYRQENTAFVLNMVDFLSKSGNFFDVRGRRERYMTLRHVEDTIRTATDELDKSLQEYEKDFQTRMAAAESNARNQLVDLQKDVEKMEADRQAGREIDVVALEARKKLLQQRVTDENANLQRINEEMNKERNELVRGIRLNAELAIQEIQRGYKLAAVLVPPIPPLLLGLIVFTRRRLREREGISKARRLK